MRIVQKQVVTILRAIGEAEHTPAHIQQLHGTRDAKRLKAAYAKNGLLAHRFLEQGVR